MIYDGDERMVGEEMRARKAGGERLNTAQLDWTEKAYVALIESESFNFRLKNGNAWRVPTVFAVPLDNTLVASETTVSSRCSASLSSTSDSGASMASWKTSSREEFQ